VGQWLQRAIHTARLPLRGQRRHSTGFPYIRSHANHIAATAVSLEMTFKIGAYPLTGHGFSNRVETMDAEFSSLEEKLDQLVQRLEALRSENRELRQQLAARTDENARLGEKLIAAKTRIEALLKQIPETES
jgi:cell division protein ZapB